MTIVKLPKGITHRKCPNCGYLVSQLELQSVRLNFDCPRCKKHKLGEFIPDDKPEPPKPSKRKVA